MDELLALMTGPRRPAYVGGYDPVRRDIMEKTYGHDLEVGDPVVTMGMDPYRVHPMTDPREIADNMGTYYWDEDSIYLNPTLDPQTWRDTARHEFRHRGTHMLDEAAGRTRDFNLEELMMVLTDQANGISNAETNAPFADYEVGRVAEAAGISPAGALVQGDMQARALNREAREQMGGGAVYQSPLLELITYMTSLSPHGETPAP